MPVGSRTPQVSTVCSVHSLQRNHIKYIILHFYCSLQVVTAFLMTKIEIKYNKNHKNIAFKSFLESKIYIIQKLVIRVDCLY